MKKTLIYAALTLSIALPGLVSAAVQGSEINVTSDGKVSIKRAKVMQVAGTNFFTRVTWDDIYIRVTVVTNDKTVITKRYGEKAVPADFKEGDIIDIEGNFPPTSESFIVNARSIKNNSLEKEQAKFSGTVTAVYPDSDEFKMSTKSFGVITVTAPSAKIIKGIIPITVPLLKAGDKILSSSGTYDYSTKILSATDINVYQDPSVFVPHNFKGKIKSISSTTLPATIVVSLTTKDYTVKLSGSTKLINKYGDGAALSRFQVGDNVRFYGAIRKDDLSVVDSVEIFRNLDL